MAGSDLFIGEMLEKLNTKLDLVTLKLDTLHEINTTVGQSVSSGNVIPGNSKAVILNNADIIAGSNATVEVGRVKIFAKGKITVSGKIKHSSGNFAALLYSFDGGTTKTRIGSQAGTTYTLVSDQLAVTDMQELILYLQNTVSGNTATIEANSCKVSYDVVNLAVDGYILKV